MALTKTTATPPRDRRTWTLQDADNALRLTFPGGYDEAEAKSIAAYMQGEHFQDGEYWMGAGKTVSGGWETGAKDVVDSQYTPVPEAASCLAYRVNGACGNEAAFTVEPRKPAGAKDPQTGVTLPSTEQLQQMEEWKAETAADWTHWRLWGGRDYRKPTGVRGMVAQASAHQSGGACLRAYYNPLSRTDSIKNADGSVDLRIPQQPTRAEAFKHIPIVAPPPDRCCVYTDPDTNEKTGIFRFSDPADGKPCVEIWYASGGVTVYRMLKDGETTDNYKEFPSLGGHLPIVQADIGTLWTPAVLRIQRQLDSQGTGTGRVLLAQAYGQRTEINAEEDGVWMTSPPAGVEVPRYRDPEDGGARQYFHPQSAELGPGLNRRLTGIAFKSGTNDDGETWSLTTPSVHEHEPTSAEANIQGVGAFIVLLRDACHQGHRRSLLGGSTAEASGEAYEQARAAFLADIKGVAEAVDACVAEFLLVRTLMADTLCGATEPTFANEYEVQVQSHPDAGAPSTESQAATRENVRAQLISPEEGTARLGVQDVGAERTRVMQSITLDSESKLWDIVAKAQAAGCNIKKALMRAGVSEEDADELIQGDGPPNISQ